jgi:Tfp pilus assembly protein PilX
VLVAELSAVLAPRRGWAFPIWTLAGLLVAVGCVVLAIDVRNQLAESRRAAEQTHDAVRLLAAERAVRDGDRDAVRTHLDAVPAHRRTPEWADLRNRAAGP